MNTLLVMDDNLVDVIKYLMNEKKNPVNFENKATICKYIVPKNYPNKTNQILDVKFDAKKINNLGVNIYYSSGLDNNGKLQVGSERGIAFATKADTISKANELVEKAISMVDGDFVYRQDIGVMRG
jgi:phosphoribosylamine--glycine ligase